MKTLLTALCCILNVCVLVHGQYMVEIEVFGYSNPTGRCADCPIPKGRKMHSCCDNFSRTTCTRGARCDSYFFFCLRDLGDRSTKSGCSYFGNKVTFANINDEPLNLDASKTVLGLNNPLQLPGLEGPYRGIQVYIEVIDADFTPRSAPNELVDIVLIDLGPSAIITDSPAKRQNYTGEFNFVTMDLSVSTFCADNRQPPDCTQCVPGFTGDNCDMSINIDDCAGVNCSGNGVCLDGIDTFTCLCDDGFTGRLCSDNILIPDDNIKDCTSHPCGEKGQCVQNGLNSFLCICERGFTGPFCQQPIPGTTIDIEDDCIGVTCSGNGVCIDGIDSFTCLCNPGFTGKLCNDNPGDDTVTDCTSTPCGEKGQCVQDGSNSFLCICDRGFTGPFCQQPIGNTINIEDDCIGVTCSGNGVCIDGIDSFTCLCDDGFTGRLCNDNVNIPGDGTVNDCTSNPCGDKGQCVQNGLNSFLCICERGFTGPFCQKPIGTTIDNEDDCIGVTCSGNGVCVDGVDSFSCDCSSGFTGRLCEINIDDCLPNICGEHGVCVDGINTFTCVCDPGYTGRNCQQLQKVDQCAGVSCSGNGRCVEGEFTFHCICDPGFAGRMCNQININDCTFNTCINGQCVVNNATSIGECTCDSGFTGDRCQTNINDCAGVNCSGNGVCVDGINSFSCECNAGFEGQLCNVQRLTSDNCSSANPCVDNPNSPCEDGPNSTNYTCPCSQCPQADSVEGNNLRELAPLIGASIGTILLMVFTLAYVCVAVAIVCRIRRRRRKAKEYELI